MKKATLCLLTRENKGEKEILLAMKKRGFGKGKWNGMGGKLDLKKDKDIFAAAKRELEEEIGVKAENIQKTAVLNFSFPYQEEWNQQVHVFFVKNWQGNPQESEEMRPEWFKIKEIPFNQMWSDDILWLPEVLKGKKIKADFVFKKGENVSSYEIRPVRKLD